MPQITIDVTEEQLKSWGTFANKLGFTLEDFVKRAIITYIYAKKQQIKGKIKVKLNN